MASSEGNLPAGTRLNEYEVLSTLGEGGFAFTYRARHHLTGEAFAIKELYPMELVYRDGRDIFLKSNRFFEDFQYCLRQFRRESETICNLSHPNIVKGIKTFKSNNTDYLVMSYQSGAPLQWHLRQKEHGFKTSLQSVAKLFSELLEAVSYIHSEGILHLDLKPSNIYLTPTLSPVILDFGTSKAAMKNIGLSSESYSNDEDYYSFTKHYAPIELMSQDYGEVGAYTDIYQLGAIFYRILIGSIYSKIGKIPDALQRVERDDFFHISDVENASKLSNYPINFLKGIDAALALYSKDRPQNIQMWRSMLDEDLQKMLKSSLRNEVAQKKKEAPQKHTSEASSKKLTQTFSRNLSQLTGNKKSSPLKTSLIILISILLLLFVVILF